MPITADFNLTFLVEPDPLAPGSGATAGLRATGPISLRVTGGEAQLYRVVRREHVNKLYGSAPVDNAITLGVFPGLEDDGAGNPVPDWEGQPLDFTTLRLLAVVVQRVVEWSAAAAISDLTGFTATAPTDGETVTLAGVTYTFKTTLTPTTGEVLINGSAAAALLNLSRAINYTGTAGTDYVGSAAHPDIEAAATVATVGTTKVLSLAARVAGEAGNALATSTTAASLSFSGLTFAGGAATSTPLTPAPFGGTVTVELDVGTGPHSGVSSGVSKMVFGAPGVQLIALPEGWTPATGGSITIAFDAPSPGVPADVNAIATLILIGNPA